MDRNNTEAVQAASEHPEQRLRRLSKEISIVLNDIEGQYLVMIYPSASRQYPVHICLDSEFADMMQQAIARREGAKNEQPRR